MRRKVATLHGRVDAMIRPRAGTLFPLPESDRPAVFAPAVRLAMKRSRTTSGIAG
jgi:hypothetical protein